MRAAQSHAQGGQSALAELCRLYWYPLYVFARLSGHSPEGAQDLMQGFFLHLLEHRAPAGVDRLKGKFRSFLLALLQSYLSDELDRARCHKRGGNEEIRIPGRRRRRRTLSVGAGRVLNSRKSLRCPVGDDGRWRSDEPAAPGIRYRGKSIHIRNAKSFLRSYQQHSSAVVRRGGASASGQPGRCQDADSSVAQTVYRPSA